MPRMTEADVRRVVGEMMSEPIFGLPNEFKSWLTAFVEINPPSIPFGQLTGIGWKAFTPTLTADTNPTLGAGSVASGRYVQYGKLVIVNVQFTFGTSGTNAGTGDYVISLPVNTSTELPFKTMGSGHVTDAGVDNQVVTAIYNATGNVKMIVESGNTVTHAVPFAWGASDRIHLLLIYEAV